MYAAVLKSGRFEIQVPDVVYIAGFALTVSARRSLSSHLAFTVSGACLDYLCAVCA